MLQMALRSPNNWLQNREIIALDYLVRPSVIIRIIHSGRGRQQRVRGRWAWGRTVREFHHSRPWTWRKGDHEARTVGGLWELEKQGDRFPPRAFQREHNSTNSLIIVWRHPCQSSDPQTWKIVSLYCGKPYICGRCYGSTWKLIHRSHTRSLQAGRRGRTKHHRPLMSALLFLRSFPRSLPQQFLLTSHWSELPCGHPSL